MMYETTTTALPHLRAVSLSLILGADSYFFLKEVSPLLLFTHLKLTAELHIKICLWSRVVSPPSECEGDGLPSGYGSRDSILRASTERDWKRRKRGQLGRLNR